MPSRQERYGARAHHCPAGRSNPARIQRLAGDLPSTHDTLHQQSPRTPREEGGDTRGEGEPRCRGTRKDGEPCGAWQQVDHHGYCRVHSRSSTFDSVETGRRAGKKSGERRRELAKTARELLRERVEAERDRVWNAYSGALEAETADGLPDHRARYQAASALLAEAYGKPLQPTQETGGPVQFIIEGRPPRGEPVEHEAARAASTGVSAGDTAQIAETTGLSGPAAEEPTSLRSIAE